MQQQICQQEQMNSQQQQQVMLCPVRLVYETQILVQPGEQIQPNQTLFINPQNPPPWIQNRAQNQVIYMQQLPNNMVQAMPQQMDQNQLYIQNYAYPQVSQQMINQMEQLRQMPNVMTQNMMVNQNIGQNIGQNVGQNVGLNVGQNVMPMGNMVQNVQKAVGVNVGQNVGDRVYAARNVVQNNAIAMANQNAIANVNQPMERVQMNQNLVNMQKVAELQGMRQQQNIRQPQVTVSPMQQAKFGPNVGDIRPTSTRPQMTNVMNNLVNLQPNMAKKVPLPNKSIPNVIPNQVRHYNQTYYRPIQPRPMSVMPMVQNQYQPMQTGNIVPRPQTQVLNDLSRKRKSESPDETIKKIPNTGNTNHFNNQTITSVHNVNNQMINVVHSDIGINTINTNPREAKLVKTVETMSTGTQANIAKPKPQIDNVQKVMEIKAIPSNVVKDNVSIQTDDKLVRNTVFTQARGLLRTETQMIQPDVISIQKIENVPPQPAVIEKMNTETVKEVLKDVNVKEMDKNVNVNVQEIVKNVNPPEVKNVVAPETVKTVVLPELKNVPAPEVKTVNVPEAPKSVSIKEVVTKTETNETKDVKVKTYEAKEATSEVKAVKKEVVNTQDVKVKKEAKTEPKIEKDPKIEVNEKKPVKIEAKDVKDVNKKYTVTAISDFKGNEIQIADGSVRKEDTDSYILTHVLDGYVIQESNTAFPIRKPLKEKTIYQNTESGMEQKKEESYKHRTEDGKVIKDNSKILSISDLNLTEDDKIKSEDEVSEDKNEDHPFANLKPATIKTWTVDQLATHLSKYKWAETISVLSEHEIDGESLFLVSKPQLVHIGVSEEHAEVICEFIKK